MKFFTCIRIQLLILFFVFYGCSNDIHFDDLAKKYTVEEMEDIFYNKITTESDARTILGKPYSIAKLPKINNEFMKSPSEKVVLFYSYPFPNNSVDSIQKAKQEWQGIGLIFENGKLSNWVYYGRPPHVTKTYIPEIDFVEKLKNGISASDVLEMFGKPSIIKRVNKKFKLITYKYINGIYNKEGDYYYCGCEIIFNEDEKLVSFKIIKSQEPTSEYYVDLLAE